MSVRIVDIGLFLLQFGHVCLNEAFLVLEGLLQKLVPERGETLFSTEHLGLDHWTRCCISHCAQSSLEICECNTKPDAFTIHHHHRLESTTDLDFLF
jgi:hypothetical protein